jgi:hypothetical protein
VDLVDSLKLSKPREGALEAADDAISGGCKDPLLQVKTPALANPEPESSPMDDRHKGVSIEDALF